MTDRHLERIRVAGTEELSEPHLRRRRLALVPIEDRCLRDLFDEACGVIHYAGACWRVGRCMRLAIAVNGEWAGGIVLGSTFPNIRVRDEAFGLTTFTRGYRQRGLVSAWASENRDYWDRLQQIVNHARTFVFPEFQGGGLGVSAHKALPREGLKHWKHRYPGHVAGLDTLCTSNNSRMFLDNGWQLVGRTAGYSRDPKRQLSTRVREGQGPYVKDNAALIRRGRNPRWWTWVLSIAPFEAG